MEHDLDSKSLPQLRAFLVDRGVRITGYKKQELLELAKEVVNCNIEPKSSSNDENASVCRRTVNGKTYSVPCHPDHAWTDNLTNMPNLETFDVQFYLKNNCGWTNDRLKTYKNDNSFRLHSNGHISNVSMAVLDSQYRYLKAQCIPEERQSADPYKLWILIDKNGVINSGECTCVAGDGTCKHIAAFLFGLQQFVQGLNDRSEIGVTDKLARWTNPVRSTRPVNVTQLDLRKQPSSNPQPKPTEQFYKPVSVDNLSEFSKKTEKQVYKLLKQDNIAACAAYTLSDSSESEYEFEEPIYDNVIDFSNQYYEQNHESSFDDFVLKLKGYFDKQMCDKISDITKSQSLSDIWYHQRVGRITASRVHSFTGHNEDASLVKQILGQNNYNTSSVPSLMHGR